MKQAPQRWTWKAVKGATGIRKGIGPKGQIAYQVRWRPGGTRTAKETGRTFAMLTPAKSFRARLVANGYQDPDIVVVAAATTDDAERQHADIGSGQPTLREAIESYLATLRVSGRTIREYRSKAEHHIYPVIVKISAGYTLPLGDMPVREAATPEVMIAWLAQKESETYRPAPKKRPDDVRHYSPKQLTEIVCSILSPAFEYALAPRRRWIEANPCRDEEFNLPERKGRTVKLEHIITPTEFALWIDAAYDADHRVIRWGAAGTHCLSPQRDCGIDHHTGDILTFILGSGMRWSEVTAIRWCDVNLDAAIVTLCRVVKEDERGALYIDTDEGKTGNAFRSLRIPPSMVAMLRRRKARRGDGEGETALIFPAPGARRQSGAAPTSIPLGGPKSRPRLPNGVRSRIPARTASAIPMPWWRSLRSVSRWHPSASVTSTPASPRGYTGI